MQMQSGATKQVESPEQAIATGYSSPSDADTTHNEPVSGSAKRDIIYLLHLNSFDAWFLVRASY